MIGFIVVANSGAGTPEGAGFTQNYLVNSLSLIKIEPFKGDSKEWPTFISSF
jgi:hypothetical protein